MLKTLDPAEFNDLVLLEAQLYSRTSGQSLHLFNGSSRLLPDCLGYLCSKHLASNYVIEWVPENKVYQGFIVRAAKANLYQQHSNEHTKRT